MKVLKTLALALAVVWLSFAAPAAALAADENLTVFIWSEYMDPDVITAFEKEHNIKVRLDYYESNEEMVAKLQSGGVGQYDIIVPSTYFMPSLKKLDLIRPLDRGQVPNLKNIAPEFQQMEADPGNEYTIPYQWGTSGMVVRSKDISGVRPSWSVFFDPGSEVGNYIIFDTARDAIGSALKYLGYSYNTTNPKEIEEAARLLLATKKRAAFFGFDGGVGGLNKVMGGIATVAQVYSGEAIRAGDEDPDVHYLLPEEGVEISVDLVAVPKNAPNPEAAHKFINFILEPQIGAQLATYNRYATPNAAAMEFIPEEDRNNPAMYPTAEQMKNMEYMEDLGPVNRIYEEAWTMVKTQ